MALWKESTAPIKEAPPIMTPLPRNPPSRENLTVDGPDIPSPSARRFA